MAKYFRDAQNRPVGVRETQTVSSGKSTLSAVEQVFIVGNDCNFAS